MTTILVTFSIALTLSLVLTPLAGRLGTRFGAMDVPSERKVHEKPVPRVGGAAIFLAFLLTMLISSFLRTDVSSLFVMDRQMLFLLGGAFICFGVGVFDDFRRLGARKKLIFQILAASVAFYGGINVNYCCILGHTFHFGFLSYFLTVFWFVLFINAVNLVDGLDGLAGCVVFFASMVMVLLSVIRGEYMLAMLFSVLSGCILGFLRYNFNPATIFLGDGGSYFLGYAIAGLSIIGGVKNQLGVAVMIPLLALGVPLFDTMLSTVRRFIRGKKLFQPDKGHIHHRLLEMGFSTKRAVMIIYTITLCLCIFSVIMVNIRDERAGLFLVIIGAGAVIFVRKLGYFDYIASDKVMGWFKDLTDEAGFSRDRRSFLSLQIDINQSENIEELWRNVIRALEKLEFDKGVLYLANMASRTAGHQCACEYPIQMERRGISPSEASICMRKAPPDFSWARHTLLNEADICSRCLLRLELPLLDFDNISYGTIVLLKDMKSSALSHYSLRRVEHLRRTVIGTMGKIMREKIEHTIKKSGKAEENEKRRKANEK